MNVVGWPLNLQADWKVRDQTHWKTERAVVWAVQENLGSELGLTNSWLYWFLALVDPEVPAHPALQDFLQEVQHRVEA